MPKKTFYSKLLLLAIALTLIAVAAKSFLPQRVYTLAPNTHEDEIYFLLDVNNDPEHKKAFWVDNEKMHFHCIFGQDDQGGPCNIIFKMTADGIHGLNLKKFKSMKLDITYKGNAKTLRIAIRSFDPRFSKADDGNSTKFNYINLRTTDLEQPVRVDFDELTVADWWIAQFNLPRELNHPDVNNAMTFSVDIWEDMRNSEHDIQINKIEFIGDWISTENWYLSILLVWMIFGTIFTLIRLIHLQRQEKMQMEKISDLVVTNSQLRSETDKFRKLSTVDALTNAFNRHGIEQIIESIELRLDSTSIIIMDIDHFKRINDRRGHDTGDRVLQKLSQVVLNNTRASDKFGRWGGEEFILICPNTSVDMALGLAEKLRNRIFQTVFEEDNPVAVSASFGVTAIHANEPFTKAFKRADEALYQAKAMGRNCVVAAQEEIA